MENIIEENIDEQIVLENLRQLSIADLTAIKNHFNAGTLTVARANPGLFRDQQYLFVIEKNVRKVFAEKLKELAVPNENIVAKLKIALADSIRRPLGVIPDSAEGLITDKEIDDAEYRRRQLPQCHAKLLKHGF